MERVGLEALPAMQPVIPRNRTRKGSGDGRRDQRLQSQRLALWQVWVPKGTVPPKLLPLHPRSYETGCVWVPQVPLPRTHWQKKAKSSTAYFKMDFFFMASAIEDTVTLSQQLWTQCAAGRVFFGGVIDCVYAVNIFWAQCRWEDFVLRGQ